MNELIPNGFEWTFTLEDAQGNVIDKETKPNRIPKQGARFLLLAPFGMVAPIPSFYLALYGSSSYLPSDDSVAADIPSAMQEIVAYESLTRPAFDKVYDGEYTLNNLLSKAQFKFTQDGIVYGACLVSSPSKGGADGTLISIVRFSTAKQVEAGQTSEMSGGLTYIPTA